jgi:hypothetical protein
MSSAAFDTTSLFSTEHGTVDWTSADRLRVTLGDRAWTVGPAVVRELHGAIEPLAAQVYRCNCDCRWQVRVEDRDTIVLGTDEVLRLHSLLDGAVAMLELGDVLEAASIARAE